MQGRFLHWHTADEWAYVLYGNARVTVMSPDGDMFGSKYAGGVSWPAGGTIRYPDEIRAYLNSVPQRVGLAATELRGHTARSVQSLRFALRRKPHEYGHLCAFRGKECGCFFAFGLFLIVMFLLVGWLLYLAYRETEQDFPPAHRCHAIRVR